MPEELDDFKISLPRSAEDTLPGAQGCTAEVDSAYIRNPIADRPMLTPMEAMDAISKLSAILTVDDRYRATMAGRRVFNG